MSDDGHRQSTRPFHDDHATRPTEYYIDRSWDRCIDLTLRRVTYGVLFAGLGSLILLSGFQTLQLRCTAQRALNNPGSRRNNDCAGGGGVRAAATGIGAGFGAGSAYTDCQRQVT